MPTLTRILVFFAILAAIVYGAMFALANLVTPTMHPIVIEIPASKINQTIIAPPISTQPPATPEQADLNTEPTMQENQ